MKKQKEYPEILLENIYWSFKEPLPDSPYSLIEAVANYHSEINEAFDQLGSARGDGIAPVTSATPPDMRFSASGG